MKENESYEVTVEDLSHQGEGIAKVSGFPLFIPGALPGDRLTVTVTHVKKNFGLASVTRIINPSAERVDPLCEKFGLCGGCQTMSLAYAAQLRYKSKRVRDSLERIGHIGAVVLPTLGMQDPWYYRNKTQLPVGGHHQQLSIGFYQPGSHRIVDTDRCYIQHPVMDVVRKEVRQFVRECRVSVYDEKTGKGLLRHLVVKTGFASGEVMVILVINGATLPQQEILIARLLNRIPGLVSVVLNHNRRKTNVIMGRDNTVIYGEAYLTDRLHDLTFRISPQAFFQVNPSQTGALYAKTLEYAALTGTETVLDLYCGIGSISLLLAQRAKKVIGIETLEAAVKDARANAALNGIANATFMTGPAEKCMPQLAAAGSETDVIVVDPPRKGCDEAVLTAMLAMKPARIVYVSCNPATLARDMRILADGGYRARQVQPVDMFPHSAHVETVALLSENSQ